MRRSACLVLFVLPALLGACGSGDNPALDPEAVENAATSSTSSTTAPAVATTVEPRSAELTLTGDAEVPGPGSRGTATASLTYDGNELCLRGETSGVGAVTNGHIHAAPAGEAGAVVVDLGIQTDGDGPFEGCALVGAEGGVVFVDPASYYVNLHTAEFPDGAVRAQLA